MMTKTCTDEKSKELGHTKRAEMLQDDCAGPKVESCSTHKGCGIAHTRK